MKRLFSLTLALVLTAAAPGIAAAQSPAGSQYADERPTRGMSMASVERAFGTPLNRRAAVGEPPITRWIYGDFTVYFEHDRVIHAVVNKSAAPASS